MHRNFRITTLAGIVIVATLLTGLIEFPYALDGIGRLADALGL